MASPLTKRQFYMYASSNQFLIDSSFEDLEIKRFNINLCVQQENNVLSTEEEHPFSTIEKGCFTASLHKNNTDIYFISLRLIHQKQAFFFLFFLGFRVLYRTGKLIYSVSYKSCCSGIWY